MQVCVDGFLVRSDDPPHLLLGRRSAERAFWPGVWDVLGGHGEPGEAPEQTLVCELREEIGVTPTAWHWLGDIHTPPGWDEAVMLHLYAVTAWQGRPANCQPAEHAELTWFSVDAACRLDLAHPGYPALFRRVAPNQ